mmetsp:Transcript_33384/g.61242  ORF Transcript_33384/g.61242 Transcript_33384/m.61242 type:complete len:246 (-) Transcript_33384:85-822(-)
MLSQSMKSTMRTEPIRGWRLAVVGCVLCFWPTVLHRATSLRTFANAHQLQRESCRLGQIIMMRHSRGRTALRSTGDESSGKFYQLEGVDARPDLVQGGFGPLGVIVAGWSDDDLEYVVAPALANIWQGSVAGNGDESSLIVPVRVLSQGDLEERLEGILESMDLMDSVMPEVGQDAKVERPFLLFSGWPPEIMMKAVNHFRNMVSLRQVQTEPMMAMVVPRAMKKPLKQLVEEIQDDFDLNSQRK